MSLRRTAAALVLVGMAASSAQSQILQSVVGGSYTATGIGTSATLGTNLLGMLVTGRFGDGQSFSANWGSLAGGMTGVEFAGRFSLTVGATSDTWSTPFALTVFGSGIRLDALTINGATGPIVFDRSYGGTVGTVASQSGRDFAFAGTADLWNTLVSYRNPVSMLGSAEPVGDIFETMLVEFRQGVTGTPGGRVVYFRQDIDHVIDGGLILPVPEPDLRLHTVAGALIGLAVLTRRRRHASHVA